MTAVPHPDLERWRTEFPILQTRTYLNSCSLGALSRRSMGYLGEYQALWNTMGASAWYELWLGRIADLRRGVATLWNARQAEVAFSPSVSAALSSVASAVDYTRRNRVVIAELDFPTLAYQWLARRGVEVVRVPSDDGVGIPPERWAEYVDERTAIVATSHVFFSTGYIQELEPISRIAHEAGALFLVDGYQAVGQVPVDPRASGADVYIGGPLKWLLGGPGLAFLWVREERIAELEPTVVSWFGVEDQFEFRIDAFRPQADAARFSLGTPAVPTIYTALGGVEIILEVGMERIREQIDALTGDLVGRLREAGHPLRISDRRERRSGIVMVQVEDSAATVHTLAERGIIVDRRSEYVRISPHFYNTPDENALVVSALPAPRAG
ncbi:MAG TPA: aminotransferase class V-fold PLP-dependent enzyme [Longimicrobiaceae bacterium]|nr:aminotransferase class V-fold PLP-dependent enzyme [Longimicrobiaceae bacterium]